MADAAHAAGMKVGVDECWLYKETDSELSTSTTDLSVQERNVYSFWAPLDAMFLETMTKTAYWKDFEFLSPFWSLYYFAYLDYDTEQPLIARHVRGPRRRRFSRRRKTKLPTRRSRREGSRPAPARCSRRSPRA